MEDAVEEGAAGVAGVEDCYGGDGNGEGRVAADLGLVSSRSFMDWFRTYDFR